LSFVIATEWRGHSPRSGAPLELADKHVGPLALVRNKAAAYRTHSQKATQMNWARSFSPHQQLGKTGLRDAQKPVYNTGLLQADRGRGSKEIPTAGKRQTRGLLGTVTATITPLLHHSTLSFDA
jgi:hypothetical protein